MSTRPRGQRVVKPPEVRRSELLKAAGQLVVREGASVAVSDIAAAAGTATGNVYRYFSSRDDLLAALKTQVVDAMLDRLVSHLRPDADWWSSADALLEAMVDFWLYDEPLHRVVLAELGDVTREAFDSNDRRAVDVVAAGIRAGIERGDVAAGDPTMAASLIVHAVFGTLEHVASDPENFDRARVLAAVREMVRKMLAAPT